jgi:hypothetical protein
MNIGMETHDIPLPFGAVPQLELTAPACVLALVATEPGQQPFLESSEALADVFRPDVRREGETVRVHVELSQPFPFSLWDFGPRVQLTLHVPANVRAKVRLDAGRARMRGLSDCDLDVETGAGVLTLRDVSGRIRLQTGAGKISGEHLSGAIEAETSAGAIRLQVDRLATGKHRIHSAMGSVRVDLAPGQKVQVDARASMGSVRNSYPSSPGAEALLEVQTEFGSVRVVEGGGESTAAAGAEDVGFGVGMGGWWGGFPGFFRRLDEAHQRHRWGMGWSDAPGRSRAGPPGAGWAPPPPPPTPPQAAPPPVSDEELRRVLTLVQEGKLSAEDAQKVLRAMGR